MQRDSFVFFFRWANALRKADAKVRLEVYDAIIEYAQSGTLPELGKQAQIAFDLLKEDVDKCTTRYDAIVEARREAGRKGAMVTNGRQTSAKPANVGKRAAKPANVGKTSCSDSDSDVTNVTDNNLRSINASLSKVETSDAARAADADEVKRKAAQAQRAKDVADYYNAKVKAAGARLRACLHINDFRRGLILARIAEYGEEAAHYVIDKAAVSNFLNYTATNAPVDLEWLMRPKNFPKVLEGKYDNRPIADSRVANIHFAGEDDRSIYEHEEDNWQ